jgi:transposase
MMGTKLRHFSPLPNLSLEELVPKDNFYRRLDAMLDLSFVRDLVEDCCYASSGRPSVDPVVFFRLQLVMFSLRTSARSGSLWRSLRTA